MGYKQNAYDEGYSDGIAEARVCPVCEQHVVNGNAKHPWVIRMRMCQHLERVHGLPVADAA